MTNFPIAHDSQWSEVGPVGQSFYIHTVGHITAQGQVYLQVTTSSNSWGLGFTGGTSAFALAGDGTIIWSSQLHQAGVDAKSIFWGRSSRVDVYFSEWIPAEKLAQVASLEFFMAHTPHDRWAEDWQKASDGVAVMAKTVKDVISALPSSWIKPSAA